MGLIEIARLPKEIVHFYPVEWLGRLSYAATGWRPCLKVPHPGLPVRPRVDELLATVTSCLSVGDFRRVLCRYRQSGGSIPPVRAAHRLKAC